MLIPGFLIAWATFPGVIVHEFAHQLFCGLTNTKVVEVCYFRFGNPSGYVIHEEPESPWDHLWIGVGPMFVNSMIGFLLGVVAWQFKEVNEVVFGVLMWLAVSIGMHSFPSTGDATSIWQRIWGPGGGILPKLVGTPLVIIIFLGAVGSIFWLDLIYGVGVAYGLPSLLFMKA